jgi:hypothetical protein
MPGPVSDIYQGPGDNTPYVPTWMEEETFDCHMGPDGFCEAAGSEDCELRCPYRRGS